MAITEIKNNYNSTYTDAYAAQNSRMAKRSGTKLTAPVQADQAQNAAVKNQQSDRVDLSEEGRSALMEKMSAMKRKQIENMDKLPTLSCREFGIMSDFNKVMSELGNGRVSDEFVTDDYSQEAVDALKARFEQQEGAKTDMFDSYVNKMASAYGLMKERIEKKYEDSDRPKEYYTAEDGSMQELTKDKELEMLDKAYDTQSRFMSVSTQIWSELKDFKAQVNYHSGGAQAQETAVKNKSTNIREQAYNAFMSAVSEENIGRLKQETGSLNSVRLNLDISASDRNVLNSIWDYNAQLKR